MAVAEKRNAGTTPKADWSTKGCHILWCRPGHKPRAERKLASRAGASVSPVVVQLNNDLPSSQDPDSSSRLTDSSSSFSLTSRPIHKTQKCAADQHTFWEEQPEDEFEGKTEKSISGGKALNINLSTELQTFGRRWALDVQTLLWLNSFDEEIQSHIINTFDPQCSAKDSLAIQTKLRAAALECETKKGLKKFRAARLPGTRRNDEKQQKSSDELSFVIALGTVTIAYLSKLAPSIQEKVVEVLEGPDVELSASVFVSELPWEVTEKALWQIFQSYGSIKQIKIMSNAQTLEKYAVVRLGNEAEAQMTVRDFHTKAVGDHRAPTLDTTTKGNDHIVWSSSGLEPPAWGGPSRVVVRFHNDVSSSQDEDDDDLEEREETNATGNGGSAAEASSGVKSIGSANHDTGMCKPCYFASRSGCWYGADCQFCHLPHSRSDTNRPKPCKKSRAQYRKLFEDIAANPHQWTQQEAVEMRLPPSVKRNEALKNKMLARLTGHAQSMLQNAVEQSAGSTAESTSQRPQSIIVSL